MMTPASVVRRSNAAEHLHYYAPDTNRHLLRRIRAAAGHGAKLLLADFWTDPTHTEPLHAALMAGESRCTFAKATSIASTR